MFYVNKEDLSFALFLGDDQFTLWKTNIDFSKVIDTAK
jgi:hypothetical protein